jgi:hypothetical protein
MLEFRDAIPIEKLDPRGFFARRNEVSEDGTDLNAQFFPEDTFLAAKPPRGRALPTGPSALTAPPAGFEVSEIEE